MTPYDMTHSYTRAHMYDTYQLPIYYFAWYIHVYIYTVYSEYKYCILTYISS